MRRYCGEPASTQSSLYSDITFLVPEDIIISKMKLDEQVSNYLNCLQSQKDKRMRNEQ